MWDIPVIVNVSVLLFLPVLFGVVLTRLRALWIPVIVNMIGATGGATLILLLVFLGVDLPRAAYLEVSTVMTMTAGGVLLLSAIGLPVGVFAYLISTVTQRVSDFETRGILYSLTWYRIIQVFSSAIGFSSALAVFIHGLDAPTYILSYQILSLITSAIYVTWRSTTRERVQQAVSDWYHFAAAVLLALPVAYAIITVLLMSTTTLQ